jgi:hypothetical protein
LITLKNINKKPGAKNHLRASKSKYFFIFPAADNIAAKVAA